MSSIILNFFFRKNPSLFFSTEIFDFSPTSKRIKTIDFHIISIIHMFFIKHLIISSIFQNIQASWIQNYRQVDEISTRRRKICPTKNFFRQKFCLSAKVRQRSGKIDKILVRWRTFFPTNNFVRRNFVRRILSDKVIYLPIFFRESVVKSCRFWNTSSLLFGSLLPVIREGHAWASIKG